MEVTEMINLSALMGVVLAMPTASVLATLRLYQNLTDRQKTQILILTKAACLMYFKINVYLVQNRNVLSASRIITMINVF
jgi:hypothetical protein